MKGCIDYTSRNRYPDAPPPRIAGSRYIFTEVLLEGARENLAFMAERIREGKLAEKPDWENIHPATWENSPSPSRIR